MRRIFSTTALLMSVALAGPVAAEKSMEVGTMTCEGEAMAITCNFESRNEKLKSEVYKGKVLDEADVPKWNETNGVTFTVIVKDDSYISNPSLVNHYVLGKADVAFGVSPDIEVLVGSNSGTYALVPDGVALEVHHFQLEQ